MTRNNHPKKEGYPNEPQISLIKSLHNDYTELTESAIRKVLNQNKPALFSAKVIKEVIDGDFKGWIRGMSRELAAVYLAQYFLRKAGVKCSDVIDHLKRRVELMKQERSDRRGEWDGSTQEDQFTAY